MRGWQGGPGRDGKVEDARKRRRDKGRGRKKEEPRKAGEKDRGEEGGRKEGREGGKETLTKSKISPMGRLLSPWSISSPFSIPNQEMPASREGGRAGGRLNECRPSKVKRGSRKPLETRMT